MKRLTVRVAVLMMFAAVLAAQGKPNFAGQWVATDPAATQGMGGPGSALTVTQDDKTLKVTSTTPMGEMRWTRRAISSSNPHARTSRAAAVR